MGIRSTSAENPLINNLGGGGVLQYVKNEVAAVK